MQDISGVKNDATVTTNLPSNVSISRDHDVKLINNGRGHAFGGDTTQLLEQPR